MSTLVAILVFAVLFVVFAALRLGDRGGCHALVRELDEPGGSCAPGTHGGGGAGSDSGVREESYEDGVEQHEGR